MVVTHIILCLSIQAVHDKVLEIQHGAETQENTWHHANISSQHKDIELINLGQEQWRFIGVINYQQFEVLTYFLRFRQISTAFTCVWSSSPPSVSWLKLTLDPEWCLMRVCAGWQGRASLGSEERAVSRDVSLGSAISPRWVDDSAVRHSKASPSWACIPARNQEYTLQYYINIYLCFSWKDLALTTL